MEIVLGLWVRNFIGIALLVVIHIPYTQKWAPGHTVPGATTRTHAYIILKTE